ncbi:MAG: DNA repair protein RecN [Bacteroidota bacterium]|nr:DNA repair protein RecN [Bacteroidota bacterium]
MLRSLHISNYALISELNIDFESGLSVITGETGAGKSIILGALSLILGQRADTKFIKTDAEKCVIEAEFDISTYAHLKGFFEQNDLDNEGNHCNIRRELTSAGKSRAFINDTPVGLNVIRDLSMRLIDIHSQHENLLLSNVSYQLEVVDTIAQNSHELLTYRQTYQSWRNLQAELKQLQKTAEKQASDVDYIQFQFQQLTDANLIETEQNELESEQETLSHAEEIKSGLLKIQQLLEEDQASLPLLKESISGLSHIKNFVPNGNNWYERLQSTLIELKDISGEMRSFEERIEFNPTRLEWVENRLSEIFTLQKKYKVSSVSELIQLRDSFGKQLQRIGSFDEELEILRIKCDNLFEQLKKDGDRLTISRKKACEPIVSYLVDQLTRLGMPNIQFQVLVSSSIDFTEDGNDEVQFLFSANKNRPLQPVAQIASGGEVSRLMLSIKSLVAHKADLPTIIFDEIDTGVSGEIANRMGDIMQAMSSGMQVITITHLPQIAAKGAHHYRVYKDDSGLQTQTHIKRLTINERLDELAQMLSGKNVTAAALLNAKELLANL